MKKHTGFTLIEVLVVVLIIGVLTAIAVPQYQKAVLKSRFSSLLPTTKAVRDGNEAYYMTHGRYARLLSDLDVTATNNRDMELVLDNDSDYSHVLATRTDLNGKNNLVMYQRHSVNFPGEIHCEALAEDTRANWLCETGMHSVKSLGEVISEGYNTYVIEGTGNGLTPAQMDAANAPSCDKALSMGATCSITEDPNTHKQTKQVCYNTQEEQDYCVTIEFDENNKQTKRVTCLENSCVEETYDENGKTSHKYCSEENRSEDGKSCDRYDEIADYVYDEDGNKIFEGYCDVESMSEGGQSCDGYYSIAEYEYDTDGNITSDKWCDIANMDENGRSCLGYDGIGDYKYDASGNMTFAGWCEVDDISEDGQSCARYAGIDEYEYDAAGNQTSYKNCGADSMSEDGKTCDSYEFITNHRYDSVENKAYDATCYISEDGQSCDGYWGISETHYDSAGNIISQRGCNAENINQDTMSCDRYDTIQDYRYNEGGHLIFEGDCYGSNLSEDGRSCEQYGRHMEDNREYTDIYDEDGNMIYYCVWNLEHTECTPQYTWDNLMF